MPKRIAVPGVSLDTVFNVYRGKKSHPGEIGIEIECEGKSLPELSTRYWHTVPEGSLRGGLEYVTTSPILLKHLPLYLQEWSELTKEAKFKQSLRTSLHVHVNVSTFTLQQIYQIIGCYWILEPLLVRVNGKDREGNLFCLRSGDAEDLVYNVVKEISERNFFGVSGENSRRYSALNLAALWKFGSVEFRFIKGTTDIREIESWTKELYNFVQVAKDINLLSFMEEFTNQPAAFTLRRFFSPEFSRFLTSSLSHYEAREMLVEGYCYTYRLARALEEKIKPVINSSNEDLIEPEISPKTKLNLDSPPEFEEEYLEESFEEDEIWIPPFADPPDEPGLDWFNTNNEGN